MITHDNTQYVLIRLHSLLKQWQTVEAYFFEIMFWPIVLDHNYKVQATTSWSPWKTQNEPSFCAARK